MEEINHNIKRIQKALQVDHKEQLQTILEQLHSTDIASIISHIDQEYKLKLFESILTLKNWTDIVCELETNILIHYFEFLKENKKEKIAPLFSSLTPDDAVEILESLPEELSNWVFQQMHTKDLYETESLLQYKDGSAGRIMSPEYFSVSKETTVLEAFNALKASLNAEMIYYIYIVDEYKHLLGVASLRDLLSKPNATRMKDIMIEDVISVPIIMDQEEVARKVERYDLTAIPVVDEKNHLLGIVTVDDIIDVIREEATEDILKLAGTNEEELFLPSPLQSFKRRLPWLFVSFAGGLITVQSMSFFSKMIPNSLLLAFVPIIIGMGGNIGAQSSTIIVRGLATGRILVSRLKQVLIREILTGLLLGCFYGVILGIVAELQFYTVGMIGLMVASGMLFSMLIAATIGSVIPIVLQKFNIDPAIATGPFVLTTIDNIGLLGYLGSVLLLYPYVW